MRDLPLQAFFVPQALQEQILQERLDLSQGRWGRRDDPGLKPKGDPTEKPQTSLVSEHLHQLLFHSFHITSYDVQHSCQAKPIVQGIGLLSVTPTSQPDGALAWTAV